MKSKSIVVLILSFYGVAAFAQKQYNVLDWKTDVTLNTYLVQQMRQQYGVRNVKLNNALKSKQQTLAYVKAVRQSAKEIFDKLPEKSPLNANMTGKMIRDGYRIEKVIYQSFKNHHVTANLYVPNGTGKFPAVLLFCGHEDLSKATESYQKTAILLAKNGFVVFVIDPISQSERVQLTDENGKSLTRGATTEHTLLNLAANLVGTSVAAYELFDNQRGLDYLLTRKEVDATKIGCMGNSGGGMQTIYFAAIDERVKVMVPCSYLASRENTLATTGPADGCAQIPNEGANLLEMSDYLIAAAPKPTLVLAGRYDFIDYQGTLQSFEDLKRIYKSLEVPEKIALFTYDDGHGIAKPKREKAVQWFRKWFYNDDRHVVEADLEVLTDQELFASEKNKVSLSYPDEVTVQKYNQILWKNYAESRSKYAALPKLQKQQLVRKLLNIDTGNANISVEKVGIVKAKFAEFQKLIIRKNHEVPLPLLVYCPQQTVKKVVIWINEEGKSKLVDSAGLMQHYIEQQDVAVVFADLRGTGETADKVELNDPKYFSKDYRNAMLALHMGKPLLGQKTQDLLSVLQFIAATPKTSLASIQVNAKGNVGLAALYASFLNPKIAEMNISQCMRSYLQILEQPIIRDMYGVVLYNQLAYFDVPDLINWVDTAKVNFN